MSALAVLLSAANADTTPDPFTFTDLTNQAVSTLVTSNTVTITGITSVANVTITGTGSPQFSIAGGAWVTSGIIGDNQTLQLRLTTSSAKYTTRSAVITVGTVSDTWSVQTIPIDLTPTSAPASYAIGSPSTVLTGSTATVTGIEPSYSITATASVSKTVDAGGSGLSGTYASSKTFTTTASGQMVYSVKSSTMPAYNNYAASTVVTISGGGSTNNSSLRGAFQTTTSYTQGGTWTQTIASGGTSTPVTITLNNCPTGVGYDVTSETGSVYFTSQYSWDNVTWYTINTLPLKTASSLGGSVTLYFRVVHDGVNDPSPSYPFTFKITTIGEFILTNDYVYTIVDSPTLTITVI